MSPTEDLFITIATTSTARGHVAELLVGKESFSCSKGAPATIFPPSVMKAEEKHIQGSCLFFLGHVVTL